MKSRRSSTAGVSDAAKLSRQLRDQAKNAPADPLLPAEVHRHGNFTQEWREVNGKVQLTLRRFDSIALERLRLDGKLIDGRHEAIITFQNAEEQLFSGSMATSNLSAAAFIRSTCGNAETAKFKNDEARRLLKRIDDLVMQYRDPAHVAIFRAVVLFGETAGAAGRSVDGRKDAAQTIAKTVVLDISYAIAVALGYVRPARAA